MSAQCDNIGAMLCHLDIIGCLCMQIRPCLGLSETFYICMGCVNIQYWGAFVCTSVRCSCQILESEVSGTLWPILHHRRECNIWFCLCGMDGDCWKVPPGSLLWRSVDANEDLHWGNEQHCYWHKRRGSTEVTDQEHQLSHLFWCGDYCCRYRTRYTYTQHHFGWLCMCVATYVLSMPFRCKCNVCSYTNIA